MAGRRLFIAPQAAPKLRVTVEWLETGPEGPANQLARLILKHAGKLMPEEVRRLARRVLEQPIATADGPLDDSVRICRD